MKLSPFYYFLGLFSLWVQLVSAQEGSLYIQDYPIPEIPTPTTVYSIQSGARDHMYLGGSYGVYIFNGASWDTIRTPGSVFALAPDTRQKGRMYVGGRNFFGYLMLQPDGRLRYEALYEQSQGDFEIEQIIVCQQDIFFKSAEQIFVVQRKWAEVRETLRAPANQPFEAIFKMQDQVFVSIQAQGLHQIQRAGQNYTIAPIEQFASQNILTAIPYSERLMLLGTKDSQLHVFDGKKMVPFKFESQAYIRHCHLENGLSLPNDRLALGTRLGGVLIVNKNSRETEEVINFQTGLADDEILSMGLDAQIGLWLGHGQGVSRVDLQMPLRLFSTYNGLEGNVSTSYHTGDTLYVGTSQGLFYLKKMEDYQEVKRNLRKKPTTQWVQVKVYEPKEKTKVGKLIKKVFGKKQPEMQAKYKWVPQTVTQEMPKDAPPEKTPENIYALQSIAYAYRPIAGIRGKVQRVLPVSKDEMLVASNVGLYRLRALDVDTLIADVQVFAILPDQKNEQKFWLATEKGLYQIHKTSEGVWKKKIVFDPGEILLAMHWFQGYLWLSGDKNVYRVDPARPQRQMKSFAIANPYGQANQFFHKEKYLYLNTWNRIYRYNPFFDLLVPKNELSSNRTIINHQTGYQWERGESGWEAQGIDTTQYFVFDFLNFLPRVQDISINSAQGLWICSESQLYHLTTKNPRIYSQKADLAVHTLSDREKSFYPLRQPSIDYSVEALDLRFRLAHPFYLGGERTRYQYLLQNFDKNWSDWVTKPEVSFSHLPPGNYALRMRALNALGQVSEESRFYFRVEPPFWQTWWFYVTQTSVMVSLILLSFYFNYNETKRGRRWSQFLTILTIITLFEFLVLLIEPYVERFSGGVPLFKLLMNIILAFSLNPAERYFKAWLARSRRVRKITKKQVQPELE